MENTYMSYIGRIKNSLPRMGRAITNATSPTRDTGVGGYGVTLQSGSTDVKDPKDLTDLTLVNKTIKNARTAVEIDPTTFSSVLSQVILTNKEYKIVGDEDADPDAVAHIEQKAKEWNLEESRITTTWKGLIDGRCFIEEYLDPYKTTIDSIVHLAFDEDYYNFLEIPDPQTGRPAGYMQKAKIWTIPDNWETESFETLQDPQYTEKDIAFTPDPQTGWLNVFMPRLFQGDGNSEGFVFKVLDDVYCLKSIKNIMPDAAKMAANTVKVQVGNKDFAFKPYNDADTVEEKITKSQTRMEDIGNSFADKFKKQVILHDGSVSAEMLGNGNLPELERYINVFKQEIRSSLQTPDSRFESASSNRAVSQEQMSGDTGQVKILDYFRKQFLDPYYERYLIDYELKLAGYEDSMGMIHFSYEDENKEDELTSAQIANTILSMRPDLFDTVAPKYFPRIATELSKLESNPTEPIQTPVTNSIGIVDPNDYAGLVLDIRKQLRREGIAV